VEKFESEILLKIRRRYKRNENIKLLLQMITSLRMELGIVKSERDELLDKLKKAKPKLKEKVIVEKVVVEDGKTRKAWTKEELFADMKNELDLLRKRKQELSVDSQKWRNRYFALAVKTGICLSNSELNVQESDTTNDK
jgi:hypothetical protein